MSWGKFTLFFYEFKKYVKLKEINLLIFKKKNSSKISHYCTQEKIKISTRRKSFSFYPQEYVSNYFKSS